MMRRKGRHWVTQQLRRALSDFAQKPEAELSCGAVDDVRGRFAGYEFADDSAAGLSMIPLPPDRREGGDKRPAAG